MTIMSNMLNKLQNITKVYSATVKAEKWKMKRNLPK